MNKISEFLDEMRRPLYTDPEPESHLIEAAIDMAKTAALRVSQLIPEEKKLLIDVPPSEFKTTPIEESLNEYKEVESRPYKFALPIVAGSILGQIGYGTKAALDAHKADPHFGRGHAIRKGIIKTDKISARTQAAIVGAGTVASALEDIKRDGKLKGHTEALLGGGLAGTLAAGAMRANKLPVRYSELGAKGALGALTLYGGARALKRYLDSQQKT